MPPRHEALRDPDFSSQQQEELNFFSCAWELPLQDSSSGSGEEESLDLCNLGNNFSDVVYFREENSFPKSSPLFDTNFISNSHSDEKENQSNNLPVAPKRSQRLSSQRKKLSLSSSATTQNIADTKSLAKGEEKSLWLKRLGTSKNENRLVVDIPKSEENKKNHRLPEITKLVKDINEELSKLNIDKEIEYGFFTALYGKSKIPVKNELVSLKNDIIQTIQQLPEFSVKSISSMLHKSGSLSAAKTLKGLQEVIPVLREILEAQIFTATNLSCVFHAAGNHIKEAVTSFYRYIDRIQNEIINVPNGLTGSNITSILSGSGKRIKEAIEALLGAAPRIISLNKNKLLFPRGFSGLQGAGVNIEEVLNRFSQKP